MLTNKYAEGYPGRRYYGGCEHVDVVENLARDRAKEVFGAKYANVQPHAGAQANAAVLMALAKPGSKIMGLSLAHGGHLTHGMKLNFSGQLYDVVAYEVDAETMQVDMDTVREMALAEKPDVLIAGWSAYHAPRILRSFAKSPTRSAPSCGSTWRTLPAWWPRACTPARCRTPTSCPPPSTRRWAAPARA